MNEEGKIANYSYGGVSWIRMLTVSLSIPYSQLPNLSAWPIRGLSVSNMLYYNILGNPGFLKNISGSRDSLIEQYKQAVECWVKKQMADEGGPAGNVCAKPQHIIFLDSLHT